MKQQNKFISAKIRLKSIFKVLTRVFKYVTMAVIVLAAIGAIYGIVKVKPLIDNAKTIVYEKMSTIDKNTFKRLTDTVIYDDSGTKIGEINISNYEYAELNNISEYIRKGYVAVEDKNFAVHNGIDYKALLRAAIALVKNKGVVTQGGSTITQQVLKNNVIGTDINKWDRKLLEFFLAPEFEKMFTKGDIMEFYCNSNFYQNNCYGVETASKYYFGKSAKDVTLAEAAVLVGLSNNPSRYNPVTNPDKTLEKRHSVLLQMLEDGVITQEQFNEADNEELNLVLIKENRVKETYQVSFAIHCAALKLMETDGFKFKYVFNSEDEYNKYREKYNESYKLASNEIRGGGYTIYTSLNSEKQAKLQEIVDSKLSEFKEVADDGRYTMQGSATLVNNETSMVEAIVGGRGTEDEYNRGYQAFRQPGSSIKPIIDYAPAFETGRVYPSLIMRDEPIEKGPKNASGGYIGNISVRDAIARSTNTIAWKVLSNIGVETGLSYLEKMRFSGLSYLDSDNISLSLGGFTYGTTTFEMAKAYSTLVNGGVYKDVNCITKLEFQDGRVYFDGNGKDIEVYTPDSSYMTIDCLKGVIDKNYGTGKSVGINGLTLAGKTGTTNDMKDGWFCGMTTKYSLAVWCGYDIPKKIDNMSGGTYPGAIFKDMMVYLNNGIDNQEFKRPETVIDGYIDNKGNKSEKNTGRKDLFSQIAINRLEEEKRIAEERARREREEAQRKAEEQRVLIIKDRLISFNHFVINNKSDIAEYDKLYNELYSDILKIKSSEIKSECLNELDLYYGAMNSMEFVKECRAEIKKEEAAKKAEEERIRKEKAEKEAQMRKEKEAKEAQQKIELLGQAREFISTLRDWRNLKEVDIEVIRAQANASIERCKYYPEYNSLKNELNSLLSEIDRNKSDKNKETTIKDKDSNETNSTDNVERSNTD